MGRAYSMHGEMRNAYKILAGKPEGKRNMWKTRYRQEDNIRMYLRETG
jgi:RNA polymerase-interacting CarD/CdnL/TRCF family regulator